MILKLNYHLIYRKRIRVVGTSGYEERSIFGFWVLGVYLCCISHILQLRTDVFRLICPIYLLISYFTGEPKKHKL